MHYYLITQTIRIKYIYSVMFSLKTLYPGGVRTRIFCSSVQADAMTSVPRGQG
jgi:hypothetical protein